MTDVVPAPAVVVGIDGSRTAVGAALWAVDEAASRDIPLRLVYVVDPVELTVAGSKQDQFACARAALCDAQRAVEASGTPVKIETEMLSGKPLAMLARAARSAAMICVGSIGTRHVLQGTGSVAAALPAMAQCPVAVIRPPQRREAGMAIGTVVVEVVDDVALRYAFDEARLRGAALRAVASWRAEVPDDIADGSRSMLAQLNRRLACWLRVYPDVAVEPVVVHGDLCGFLSRNAASIEVFVTGAAGGRCDSGSRGHHECSVLTVRGKHL
jgi:nucleotide-binding universal stress UspA family protein